LFSARIGWEQFFEAFRFGATSAPQNNPKTPPTEWRRVEEARRSANGHADSTSSTQMSKRTPCSSMAEPSCCLVGQNHRHSFRESPQIQNKAAANCTKDRTINDGFSPRKIRSCHFNLPDQRSAQICGYFGSTAIGLPQSPVRRCWTCSGPACAQRPSPY
jgi:hypothetical protein